MLEGQHSVRDIQRIADEEWGLRSRKTKRQGGRPYAISTWYRIFTQPFYYGYFWWKEPGTGIRRLYEGTHEPMITEEEFNRVQILLGRKGKPAPKHHRFPFTGLIACGECGAAVTAEAKYQVICSSCKKKFSALNRDTCPSCTLAISRMTDPTRLHYIYYHCTKRTWEPCSQRSLRAKDLERQVDAILSRITISEEFLTWALKAVREQEEKDRNAQKSIEDSVGDRRHQIKRQLAHLKKLALSPDTDWELVSRDDLKQEKRRLLQELETLENDAAQVEAGSVRSLELSERTFRFAAYARYWFSGGDHAQKRDILAALGSNLTLKDQELALDLRKPLRYIEEMAGDVPAIRASFEPEPNTTTKRKTPSFHSEIPRLCGGTNAVRTWWEKNLGDPSLPQMER